jgi:hypothetical protein
MYILTLFNEITLHPLLQKSLKKLIRMNTTLKSIGAIIAGFICVFVLSIATDHALEAMGLLKVEPYFSNPWWIILIVIICRCIYTITGGYITARLAPKKPMEHVLILGIIGLILNIIGAVMLWNIAPHWFSLLLIILYLPCVVMGAKLNK